MRRIAALVLVLYKHPSGTWYIYIYMHGVGCANVCKMIWLPFSYHPWWYRTAKKALARWNADVGNSSLLSCAVPNLINTRVRFAWKNFLPSTANLLSVWYSSFNHGWRLGLWCRVAVETLIVGCESVSISTTLLLYCSSLFFNERSLRGLKKQTESQVSEPTCEKRNRSATSFKLEWLCLIPRSI